MLHVIVSVDIDTRSKKRANILSSYKEEPISISDLDSSILDLENYLFPSLFSSSNPVVHGRYLLEEYGDSLNKELLTKLVKSPTVFILEERDLGKSIVKMLEKEGALVSLEKSKISITKKSNIFSVTEAITASSKKDRWMAYQNARQEHTPEALVGILYWKLRDLIEKSPAKSAPFKAFYTSLIKAHKKAWQSGFSLDLAIEKVILEG
ncbi:MAG: hypothetical protein QG674_331 [Patescibacteria group bacterium]|nr:hypothetical protein [Patescibacteria group bacterium]